jgi:hypothetical protein
MDLFSHVVLATGIVLLSLRLYNGMTHLLRLLGLSDVS